MSTWGVLMSVDAWEVVKKTWVNSLMPLGWVSVSPQDTCALLAEGGVEYLLVEADPSLLTPEVVDAARHSAITLVAVVTGPDGDDVAEGAGVLLRVRQPEDLIALVQEPSSAKAPISRATSGTTIAVWGATGSPGRTTLAAACAALLAGEGARIVLVDADPRSGAVAPALGLLDEVPGFVAACRLAHRGQLEPDELRRLAHRYQVSSYSFDVLTGVTAPRIYPEVTAETVRDVVTSAAGLWDVVVIDTGSDCQPAGHTPTPRDVVTTTVLAMCDEVIAVVAATPVGVARFSRVHADVLSHRVGKPLRVVLNGVDTSRRSLADEATLREALRRFADVAVVEVIPREVAGCRHAEMSGITVVDAVPHSPMVKALAALVSPWVVSAPISPRTKPAKTASAHHPRTPASSGGVVARAVKRVRILWADAFALR